jgi:hypothetical protein
MRPSRAGEAFLPNPLHAAHIRSCFAFLTHFPKAGNHVRQDSGVSMTPDQRLDRLERLATLFAMGGRRARNRFREQIDILMDAQMRNEVRFERNEERLEQLIDAQKRLTESQIHTDQRLDALIDIVREGRHGSSPSA